MSQDDIIEDSGLQDAALAAEADGQHRATGMMSWVASGAMHASALLLLGTVYYIANEDIEIPPVRVQTIPLPPDKTPEVKLQHRDLIDEPVMLENLDKQSDKPAPINPLELPETLADREDDPTKDKPIGREEAVALAEMGGPGTFMTIGVGPSASGMFGFRTGGGRQHAVGTGGGSKGSERAVEAALRWFKRHQSPNGMWDAERYFQNCVEAPKCEPGSLAGKSAEEVNTAMTGYALLAFLGAGYDHKNPGTFRQVVKRGMDYLIASQKPDGLFGVRNYEHPIATMALVEAYALTSDPALREPAQKAVDVIIARQNQDEAAGGAYGGLGWDYVKPTKRNDASVTGWNVMALKSAVGAGLNVGDSLHGAKRWLEAAWKANNDGQGGRPDWRTLDPYRDQSVFSYTYPTGATSFAADGKGFGHQNMAPVGLVCAVFLGHASGDVMLETLTNHVMDKQMPKAFPTNTYYLYYNTLGVFQANPEKWKVWNASVRDLLVNAQRRDDGCLDGSWDWEGSKFHGHEIGRVLSTAYNTLSLEVYYRYARAQGEKWGEATKRKLKAQDPK